MNGFNEFSVRGGKVDQMGHHMGFRLLIVPVAAQFSVVQCSAVS